MARRKINRPPPDPDDEPTRVYSVLGGCSVCRGWGFISNVVVPVELTIPCKCPAGCRILSAQPDGWPLSGWAANRLAVRIGLVCEMVIRRAMNAPTDID